MMGGHLKFRVVAFREQNPDLKIGAGQFVPVDDDCPLTHDDRTIGHEAQTIGLALELAATTGQLVFGPSVAARRYVSSGALVEVKVRGWDVTEPLFIVSNSDRVLARVQKAIVRALRVALRGLGSGSLGANGEPAEPGV